MGRDKASLSVLRFTPSIPRLWTRSGKWKVESGEWRQVQYCRTALHGTALVLFCIGPVAPDGGTIRDALKDCVVPSWSPFTATS